jgi:translocator protein
MPRVSSPIVVLNVVTLAVTLVMNVLANALPLNGRTTGEISDGFAANVFTPAGYVFSIWGLIYLGLIAFVGYQLTPAGRRSPAVGRVGGWFALTGVANALWIVLWHYEVFPATIAVMLVLLVALCAIVARLGYPRAARSAADRWLVFLPFSVYLGWISVATIANAAIVLLDRGWDGAPFSAAAWAVLMLAVATGLGAWMVSRRGDLAYAAVLVWAFTGIAAKQAAVAWVPHAAWAAVVVLVVLAGWRLVRGLNPRPGAPARP